VVTVFIWDYRGKGVAWGHASIKIDGGDPPGEVYISYWPQAAGRERSKISNNLYCVVPIRLRTYDDDVQGENNHTPNHQIQLDGLNETAMKTWWVGVTGDLKAQWCTLSNNCSTTVANALYNGGGDDIADDWWWTTHTIVWKPDKVLAYALAIRYGLQAAKAGTSNIVDAGAPSGGAP
jgi:hypothetical protein